MKMKIWLHTLIYRCMYYQKNNPTSTISTSWLYSSFVNDFFTKLINVIQDSDEIKFVDN